SGASLSGIDAGTYPTGVGASFAGDTDYTASSGSNSLTVNQANTSTDLSSNNNPSIFGQNVTFTATVTSGGGIQTGAVKSKNARAIKRLAAGAGTPTGTVTFKDNGSTLGMGTLDGSGVATFSTS